MKQHTRRQCLGVREFNHLCERVDTVCSLASSASARRPQDDDCRFCCWRFPAGTRSVSRRLSTSLSMRLVKKSPHRLGASVHVPLFLWSNVPQHRCKNRPPKKGLCTTNHKTKHTHTHEHRAHNANTHNTHTQHPEHTHNTIPLTQTHTNTHNTHTQQ